MYQRRTHPFPLPFLLSELPAVVWTLAAQHASGVQSSRDQAATTIPARLSWAARALVQHCANLRRKIKDFLGKPRAKFLSNWSLLCYFLQFGLLQVRKQGQGDCCSVIFYSGDVNQIFSGLWQPLSSQFYHHLLPTDSKFFHLAIFLSSQGGAGAKDISCIHIYWFPLLNLNFISPSTWAETFSSSIFILVLILIWRMSSQWQIVSSCSLLPFSQLLQKSIQHH